MLSQVVDEETKAQRGCVSKSGPQPRGSSERGVPPMLPLLFTACLGRKSCSRELPCSPPPAHFLLEPQLPSFSLCWSSLTLGPRPDVWSRESRCISAAGQERRGVPKAQVAGGVKEGKQLVVGLHGTQWNPALPGWETVYHKIPEGL